VTVDYWQSTKSPVHMFRREYESADVAKHVAEHSFVDAAQLAQELGISSPCVKAYQRRLGVRKITGNGVRLDD
jgi:hypothetical protein